MWNFNDLEIEFADGGGDEYRVALRLNFASSAARRMPSSTRLSKNAFAALRQVNAAVSYQDYGQALTQIVFGPAEIGPFVSMAISESQRQRRPLRLRLVIDDDAGELHAHHWETLYDNAAGNQATWLLANEAVLFSRDLGASQLDEELPARTREQLRALIVVANPNDIGPGQTYQNLAAIDVEGEVQRVTQAMHELRPPDTFVSPAGGAGGGPFVTLDGLIDKLRAAPDQGYDILYLVCHGLITNDGPRIWLQTPTGASAVTPVGGESGFVTRIKNLPPDKKPRLIVLASCDSGEGVLTTDGALAALGPRLAREADVAAVIAMGGSVSMKTIAQFMPCFFEQLARHGQIDQALAAARGVVAANGDAWMPLLYMRLSNGSLWSPGWARDDALDDFGGLPGLRDNVEAGTCVPILGPGLLDFFTGPRGSFSQRWAEDEGVPSGITPTNLPQVAQYISTTVGDRLTVGRKFMRFVRKLICEEYKELLGDDCADTDINALIEQVAGLRRQYDEDQDAIYGLASLPFPVYITTNADSLLVSALKAHNKEPREAIFPWNPILPLRMQDFPELRDLLVLDPNFIPSAKKPLVYYLFGRIDYPETLVLTEDDYLDYLMRIRIPDSGLPNKIKAKVNWESLLFLGFSHDDWSFRVMLRSLLGPSEDKPRDRRLLAAALVGADTHYEEFMRMQKYLEQYFEEQNIRIFWGSTIDFVRELEKALKKAES